MIQRIAVSIGLISLLVFAITFSKHPFLFWILPAVALFFFCTALKEYYDLALAKGYKPLKWIGLTLGALYILGVHFFSLDPLVLLMASLFFIFAFQFATGKQPIENSAITLFGLFYLIIPLSCLLLIFNFDGGVIWFFYLLAVTYGGNTAALFIGKGFGKRKLAPVISPKKTWEGAVGGIIFSALISLAFTFSPLGLTNLQALLLGLGLGISAHFGDLAESLLKRDAGVKDSGSIPGLGGVLDIVDSLAFTAPLLWLYLKLI